MRGLPALQLKHLREERRLSLRELALLADTADASKAGAERKNQDIVRRALGEVGLLLVGVCTRRPR